MRRYNITRGANTTAGGTVTTGSNTVLLMGEPLAREGDSVECPACGTVGVIVCAGRHLVAPISGSQSALEGDICKCACSPSPTLIANQSTMFQNFDGPTAPPVPLEEEGNCPWCTCGSCGSWGCGRGCLLVLSMTATRH